MLVNTLSSNTLHKSLGISNQATDTFFFKPKPKIFIEIMFKLNMVIQELSILFFCLTAVMGVATVNQTTPVTAKRPVVVDVTPNANANVNVLVQHNPPSVLSASHVIVPGTVITLNQSTTPTNTSKTNQSATRTNSVIGNGTSARFSNSQNFHPAMMLPLGSEGPNANRTVSPPQTIIQSGRQPIINQNRRVEIRLIDFQENRTGAPPQNINQNITISVKFIGGSVPVLAANEDLEVVQSLDSTLPATIFHGGTSDSIHPNTTIVPQSTSGFQQVFNGTYQSDANENKVVIQRIITAELCGQLTQFDRGYLEVSIKPSPDISAADKLSEGYYKCAVNLNYTAAAQEAEAYWSDLNHCDSGNLTNFSYRLWFKTRQYVIDAATCQNNLPVLDEHN